MLYDRDLTFVWDPAKDRANDRKHDISFDEASDVFYDPAAYREDTTRPEHREQRWKAVGRVGNRVICVIYTERNDEIRIISARAARRNERRKFGESETAP
jgi:uncharacterized DUF497 family protein